MCVCVCLCGCLPLSLSLSLSLSVCVSALSGQFLLGERARKKEAFVFVKRGRIRGGENIKRKKTI